MARGGAFDVRLEAQRDEQRPVVEPLPVVGGGEDLMDLPQHRSDGTCDVWIDLTVEQHRLPGHEDLRVEQLEQQRARGLVEAEQPGNRRWKGATHGFEPARLGRRAFGRGLPALRGLEDREGLFGAVVTVERGDAPDVGGDASGQRFGVGDPGGGDTEPVEARRELRWKLEGRAAHTTRSISCSPSRSRRQLSMARRQHRSRVSSVNHPTWGVATSPRARSRG